VAAGLGFERPRWPDPGPTYEADVNAAFEPKTGPAAITNAGNAADQPVMRSLDRRAIDEPMSAVSRAVCRTVSNIICVCAAISPGMRVRPRPSIRLTAPDGANAAASVEIDLMPLPRTRSRLGERGSLDVPSNGWRKRDVDTCSQCEKPLYPRVERRANRSDFDRRRFC
jgi:hypothetical protein